MRRILSCAGAAWIAFGMAMAAAHAADNVAPEGFVALFNGKDLTGWKGLAGDGNLVKRAQMSPEELAAAELAAADDMRAHWRADNGVLLFDGKGKSLCTAKDYGDFELMVDWKIEKDGDSGIYLRGTPQVQIWDPECKPCKDSAGIGSGGLYNNQTSPSRPLVKADKPIGEWNSFVIKMVGDKVTVKLNGQLVTDAVPLENFWERDKPVNPTGDIELQNHGNTLYFKNIYIKELPRYPDVAERFVVGGAAAQQRPIPS